MIKVRDNRKTNDVRVGNIDINGYFMYDDVLCRRVSLCDAFHYTEDGIPFIEVPCGRVALIDRDAWVTPLRDEQIDLCIEDWG